MTTDLRAVQEAAAAWPRPPAGRAPGDAARRLLDAIANLQDGRSGSGDVAALVRQVLLEDGARFRGDPHLLVPGRDPWPSPGDWSRAACGTRPQDGSLIVSAVPWCPPLREHEDQKAAQRQLTEVFRGPASDYRRALQNTPADPFWRRTLGHTHYLSTAQRSAARTVALAPEGSTIIVALPTGRGKTDVVWSRALARDSGVTVVVVPTVVLALDMERRTKQAAQRLGRQLSPAGRYAYVGTLDPAAKRAVREAIRTGQQRIVYTSPEALMTGLRDSLMSCAQNGLLRQFVVDEAHIIDQWGQDFRPEFLTMAGLHAELIRCSPASELPVTVLLSATLTGRHIDLLKRTFSPDRHVEVVWGSSLRTEPAYYAAHFAAPEDRQSAVLEAVHRLPRPLILYVSKVEDANAWLQTLREAGLVRVAAVTGQSSEEARRLAVQGWRGEDTDGRTVPTEFDVVVGTSAFGLGIDVSTVRSVVHACLPETIDRFYQEVGRAGRDGLPTVSYLATADQDIPVAKNLNGVVLIGADKGWERWSALRDQAWKTPSGALRVNLRSLPGYMVEGYQRSASWNVKALTLMAQAGLVRLNAATAPSRERDEDDDTWQQRQDAFYRESRDVIDITVVNGAGLREQAWDGLMSDARRQITAAQADSLQRMRELVAGTYCYGEILAKQYRVRTGSETLITSPACRGCPGCRRAAQTSDVLFPPEPSPHLSYVGKAADPLHAGADVLLIYWPDETTRRDLLPDVVAGLALAGAMVFHCADPNMLDAAQANITRPVIRDDDELLMSYEGLVTVIMDRNATGVSASVLQRLGRRLPTYVLGPASLPAPDKPLWRWQDVTANLSIRAALGSL